MCAASAGPTRWPGLGRLSSADDSIVSNWSPPRLGSVMGPNVAPASRTRVSPGDAAYPLRGSDGAIPERRYETRIDSESLDEKEKKGSQDRDRHDHVEERSDLGETTMFQEPNGIRVT